MDVFAGAPVTFTLLLINVMVSLYALFSDPSVIQRFAFSPFLIKTRKEYVRAITGGFLHGGIGHLAFNMLALFSFGVQLEKFVFGPVGFFILYFGSELAAHALSYYRHHKDPSYSAIGASGAVSGVVFAYCMFDPFAMLLVFFVPMPAIVFAVLYVVGSVYMMKNQPEGMLGRIGHDAHLGGAIGGVILTILLKPQSVQIFTSQIGQFLERFL